MTPWSRMFATEADLLGLEPEELAGYILEAYPSISQSAGITITGLLHPLYEANGGPFRPARMNEVADAIAEAVSWMVSQGIMVENPHQPSAWMQLTRRGRKLKSRADIQAFKKARALPLELLPQYLAEKVHHLFLRGDHDTAVFQAFKEVEVAVRKAAGFPDDLLGRELMQRAFHPENGPLTDKTLVKAEREAEMFLFSGAIGHAKNPASHRDVGLSPQQAARLIVFASHLLDRLFQRLAT